MINYIVAHISEIIAIVTGIVTVASLIVRLTPSPKDDAVVSAISKFINTLALNKPVTPKK